MIDFNALIYSKLTQLCHYFESLKQLMYLIKNQILWTEMDFSTLSTKKMYVIKIHFRESFTRENAFISEFVITNILQILLYMHLDWKIQMYENIGILHQICVHTINYQIRKFAKVKMKIGWYLAYWWPIKTDCQH